MRLKHNIMLGEGSHGGNVVIHAGCTCGWRAVTPTGQVKRFKNRGEARAFFSEMHHSPVTQKTPRLAAMGRKMRRVQT